MADEALPVRLRLALAGAVRVNQYVAVVAGTVMTAKR